MACLGGAAVGRMRARVLAEAKTTFASGYAETIGLREVLQQRWSSPSSRAAALGRRTSIGSRNALRWSPLADRSATSGPPRWGTTTEKPRRGLPLGGSVSSASVSMLDNARYVTREGEVAVRTGGCRVVVERRGTMSAAEAQHAGAYLPVRISTAMIPGGGADGIGFDG